MRVKPPVAAVLAATVVVVLAACGGSSDDAKQSTSSSAKPVNVAMVIGLTANPFMKSVEDGARDGTAAVPGAKLTYTGPPQPDPTKQAKMLQDVLTTKPAGVAIMPIQASLWVRPLKDAATRNVPMVAFNEAPLPGSPVKTFVGINDRQAAEALLKTLQAKIGQDARGTIVLGNCIPGVRTLDFRIRAYKEGIAKFFPNATVKGPYQTTTEPAKNLSNWQSVMSANRGALAYLGNCDSDGPGLVQAKRQAGVPGQILTFDTNVETLKGIKAGTMLAALNEAPYARGYIAMRMLADAGRTGKPVPEGFVNIRGEVITKANVDKALARESSVAATRAAYKPYFDRFFADPQKAMEPIGGVYK